MLPNMKKVCKSYVPKKNLKTYIRHNFEEKLRRNIREVLEKVGEFVRAVLLIKLKSCNRRVFWELRMLQI